MFWQRPTFIAKFQSLPRQIIQFRGHFENRLEKNEKKRITSIKCDICTLDIMTDFYWKNEANQCRSEICLIRSYVFSPTWLVCGKCLSCWLVCCCCCCGCCGCCCCVICVCPNCNCCLRRAGFCDSNCIACCNVWGCCCCCCTCFCLITCWRMCFWVCNEVVQCVWWGSGFCEVCETSMDRRSVNGFCIPVGFANLGINRNPFNNNNNSLSLRKRVWVGFDKATLRNRLWGLTRPGVVVRALDLYSTEEVSD